MTYDPRNNICFSISISESFEVQFLPPVRRLPLIVDDSDPYATLLTYSPRDQFIRATANHLFNQNDDLVSSLTSTTANQQATRKRSHQQINDDSTQTNTDETSTQHQSQINIDPSSTQHLPCPYSQTPECLMSLVQKAPKRPQVESIYPTADYKDDDPNDDFEFIYIKHGRSLRKQKGGVPPRDPSTVPKFNPIHDSKELNECLQIDPTLNESLKTYIKNTVIQFWDVF